MCVSQKVTGINQEKVSAKYMINKAFVDLFKIIVGPHLRLSSSELLSEMTQNETSFIKA